MPFSSIKKKTCKVKNCTKYPILGGAGMCYLHVSAENKAKKYKSGMETRRKMAEKVIGRLRGQDFSKVMAKAAPTKKNAKSALEMGKSELMREADSVVSRFVRNRDANSDGIIVCVCCGQPFNILSKRFDGEMEVQALHFIGRKNYQYRWEPDINIFAGCCYCNLKMHLEKTGRAWQNYRDFLVDRLGENKVQEMEQSNHTVTKVTVSMLKEIILKYQV